MNPKELAERLSNAYRAVTELGYESELSTLDVLDAMRQAADLLATARVEWRVGPMGGGDYDDGYSRDDAIERVDSAHKYAATEGNSWAFRIHAESRHVIETPWEECSDADPSRIG